MADEGINSSELDPTDWDQFRGEARRMLEASIDQLQQATERPWQDVPESVKDGYAVKATGSSAAEMVNRITEEVLKRKNRRTKV